MLDKITKIVPIIVAIPADSLRKAIPTTTLVTGSKVLNIDVLVPPVKNVPFWKRITPHTFTTKANTMDKIQPDKVAGNIN